MKDIDLWAIELDAKSDQLIPVNKTQNIEWNKKSFHLSWSMQTHKHILAHAFTYIWFCNHVQCMSTSLTMILIAIALLGSAQLSSLFIYHVFANLIKKSFEMLELALIACKRFAQTLL